MNQYNMVIYKKMLFNYIYFFNNHFHFLAMIMRPKKHNKPNKSPILVALHGAGVEANAEFWTNAYPKQEFSWVNIK